mmetsp:Transcript_10627/g.18673  ORF Transcript_10627/g.18673 Transcript_10627/m.18673 type:complete len:205 (-) Transcript_10627:80-694(-)
MTFLQRMRPKCNHSIKTDAAPIILREKSDLDISRSGRTVEYDEDLSLSCRLGYEFERNMANSIAGRHFKSCLKVRTQSEPLAMVHLKAQSYTPTIIKVPKKVRFDVVEFREYPRIMSDNPSSNGPPIGIGWVYDSKDTVKIDLNIYECAQEGNRRQKKELIIPPHVREAMLREAGYSRKEIARACKLARNDIGRRTASLKKKEV